jgi:hypothetical protein
MPPLFKELTMTQTTTPKNRALEILENDLKVQEAAVVFYTNYRNGQQTILDGHQTKVNELKAAIKKISRR